MKSLKFAAWFVPMLLAGSAVVYAMTPPPGGFAPNATLDPACAPGTTDCFVTAGLTEPWFGFDDDAQASDNTEDIYTLGKVSVGTNAPSSAHLNVNGVMNANSGTATIPSITMDDIDTGFFSPTNNTIGFTGAGTEVMRMTTTALGIGITSPTAKLHVVSTAATTPALSLVNAAGDGAEFLTFAGDRSWAFRQVGAGSVAHLELADLSGQKNFVINTTGNLGVGTTTPGSRLSVVGLHSGTTAANAANPTGGAKTTTGNLAGAVCVTDTGDFYIDTDGTCSDI